MTSAVYKMVPMEEEDKKESFTSCPLERVKEEFDGWRNYKDLYGEHKEERYRIASKQEFGHLIMAVEDFLHDIQSYLPDSEEAAEFNKMLSAFNMRGV